MVQGFLGTWCDADDTAVEGEEEDDPRVEEDDLRVHAGRSLESALMKKTMTRECNHNRHVRCARKRQRRAQGYQDCGQAPN